MSGLLKIRDVDGNIIEIPAIVGPPGPAGERGKGITIDNIVESELNGKRSTTITFSDDSEITINDGEKGADGYSPTVAISNITNGKRISITDKNGTKTADILNGTNGKDGAAGTNGKDGKSAYQYAVDGGYTGTEAEFAELLANSGGSSVQPDHNQNDPTAADYIKNRTHWVEGVVEVLIEEQTIPFVEDMAAYMTECTTPFIEGHTYIVNWNGTEYSCVAAFSDYLGAPYIGNPMVMGGEDNGMPFFGAFMEIIAFMPAGEPASEATISLVHDGETVHQIPDKFIKEKSMMIQAQAYEGSCYVMASYTGIKAAYDEGYDIKMKLFDETGNEMILPLAAHIIFAGSYGFVFKTVMLDSSPSDLGNVLHYVIVPDGNQESTYVKFQISAEPII